MCLCVSVSVYVSVCVCLCVSRCVCASGTLFCAEISLDGLLDVCDPLSKVNAGLQAGGSAVPLRAVHVRGKLIDLAAQVSACKNSHHS